MSSITLGMVQTLVLGSCSSTEKCPMNAYEITLIKGRGLENGKLNALKLRSLVMHLAKDKIIYQDGVTEKDFDEKRVRGARKGQIITPLPEEVLSEIFHTNEKKN